jgi:hypothetical protein
MRRVAAWGTFIGIVAVVLVLIWGRSYDRSRHDTGVSPVGTPAIGTTGQQNGDVPDDSPATLHDLETLMGSTDPHELIGRRVDFHLKVGEIDNSTSFWVGSKDNPMLVVLGRDNRSNAQRDRGAPSPNDIKPTTPGQMVHITGMIEGIPNAEARYSWGLNDSQRRELQDQKVYIRADHVTPEG